MHVAEQMKGGLRLGAELHAHQVIRLSQHLAVDVGRRTELHAEIHRPSHLVDQCLLGERLRCHDPEQRSPAALWCCWLQGSFSCHPRQPTSWTKPAPKLPPPGLPGMLTRNTE